MENSFNSKPYHSPGVQSVSKIQIIALRSFTNEDSKLIVYDKILTLKNNPKTVAEVFANYKQICEQIPKDNRWNIFYTISTCGEKKREFESCSTLAFDIDKINLEEIPKVIDVVLSVLQTPRDSVGIACSGNGIHILVGLKVPIKKKDYYKKNRAHYRAVVTKINIALQKAGVSGNADTVVFDARRILRLPGTINRKPDRPEKTSYMIQPHILPLSFDITELSGLPIVEEKDQIPQAFLKKYPKTDKEAILSECNFIKWAGENQSKVSEPEWYSLLSILARVEDGPKLCHEYSNKHKGYNEEETNMKIEQSLEASGPRTCGNINDLWGKCPKCKHFQKVNSPILLVGEDHIATENTGFHSQHFSGNTMKTKPNYEDLRKFFNQQHAYINVGDSRMTHIWDKKHYKFIGNASLEQFAQEHFEPKANSSMVREFRELVSRTHIKDTEWFSETTQNSINFENGTLEIPSMDFFPHTSDRGFRYVLPYSYDRSATSPVFSAMLERITGGAVDLQQVILEFMGYCLAGSEPWAQKSAVLVGEGANGKSTLMDVMRALAGDGNYCSFTMEDIHKSEYNRQVLDGKLFNVSEETPDKALVASSYFKTLVTGGEIQARSPYKDTYFVKNKAKLVFTCNRLPSSIDTSYGFYRRLLIIPFHQRFTKKDKSFDPRILNKIMQELPGVFNLVIAGYQRLLKNEEFTESSTINNELEEYKELTDNVLRFYKECVVVYENGEGNGHFVEIADLYDKYKLYAQSEGEEKSVITKKMFCKQMSKLVSDYKIRVKQKKVNGYNYKVLTGMQYIEPRNVDRKDAELIKNLLN